MTPLYPPMPWGEVKKNLAPSPYQGEGWVGVQGIHVGNLLILNGLKQTVGAEPAIPVCVQFDRT